MTRSSPERIALNQHDAETLDAVFERMFPADDDGPGAVEIGVTDYVDKALSGAYYHLHPLYRAGLAAIDREMLVRSGKTFKAANTAEQDQIIQALERNELSSCPDFPARDFFETLRTHLQEGVFADPVYGGNKEKSGWRLIKHPGVGLENSAEENLMETPADKGGLYQSLSDLGASWQMPVRDIPGFDPLRGQAPPADEVDVILVGVGSMNSIVAPILTEAGLKVIGFEPGPFRSGADYFPDELGSAYYCRALMGPKFANEIPRWRRNDGEPTAAATFSLGRMMNSVGGSVIHYGAWLRRFHPHHFQTLSWAKEQWGLAVLPEGCRLADWPVCYEELEPFYTRLEHEIGVAGDESNPFISRSKPLPLPAMRPFRLGNFFSEAT